MVSPGLTFQRVVSRAVLAVFSLLLLASAPAQPAGIAGTMPEDYLPELKPILAHALQRSPETIAKEFDRLAAEAKLTQANASRLPRVGGNFNYGITRTAIAANTSRQESNSGFYYSFGLSQAIFHWGALSAEREAARISVIVSNKGLALAYRELSVMLRRVYLALIVEKAELQQARKSLQLVRDDLAIVRAKKESGSVSGAAVAGEELRERELSVELARVEADFAANRRRFARLAGIAGGDLPEEKIPSDIPRPVYSEPLTTAMLAALLRDHAKGTIEYEIYDLKLRDAVLRQKIAATRLLPKFGANASYTLENSTNVNGNLAEQVATIRQSAGIGGSWDIFDGFATGGAKREALISKRALEQRKTADIEELLQNAQARERALKVDAELLDITDTRHGMALEGRDRIATEVGFGNLAKGEIERAQIGILQADAKKLGARATFLNRWSEFVALAGHDPVLNNLPARHVREKK